MQILNFFLYFVIYSFIGWFYESLICSIGQKKLVNRGFLSIPLCPIYGFGAIITILALFGKTDNPVIVFFVSMFLVCLLEYLTSLILEKIFHMRWWDYTNRPFNIAGRVYLLGAVVFASLSSLLIFFIHPQIKSFVLGLPHFFVIIFSIFMFFVIIFDLLSTVRNLSKLNKNLAQIQSSINRFKSAYAKHSEDFKGFLVDKFEESEFYNENIAKLFTDLRKFQIRRIVRSFPHLEMLRYEDAWGKFKQKIKQSQPKKRRKK